MSDISSVTGSEPTTERGRRTLNDHFRDESAEDYNHMAFDIVAIEREAVDAFVRDELPGLLKSAADAIGMDMLDEATMLAAKIAELRDE